MTMRQSDNQMRRRGIAPARTLARGDRGEHRTRNTQHPTSNVEHPIGSSLHAIEPAHEMMIIDDLFGKIWRFEGTVRLRVRRSGTRAVGSRTFVGGKNGASA